MEKFKYLSIKDISKLPKAAGVYCFKNSKETLYIGKAANIRERVKTHLKLTAYRDNLFINQVKKAGYIKTNSEIEALILEANLIKKVQPKYNVVWRDDKKYFFVARTQEDFPRVFITHQPRTEVKGPKYKLNQNQIIKSSTLLKATYIGPFVDGRALKQTLNSLRKAFPFRSYRTLPKKPCLWYQLGRCPGPCLLNSSLAQQIPDLGRKIKKECQDNARNLFKILQGKRVQVLKILKREMKELSKREDYEKAAKIRDRINSLEKVISHSQVFGPLEDYLSQANLQKILKLKKAVSRIEAYDVSNIQGKEAAGSMVTFIKGAPDKNLYRRFRIKISGKPNDTAMIGEVLSRRIGHPEWGWPDLILIDGGKPQLSAANSILRGKIPVIAIAKRKNELFLEKQKKPILLKSLPREIFNLILQLRDEAHRFALSYHKKLRKKTLLK